MSDLLGLGFNKPRDTVDTYEEGDLFIDTCSVTDTEHPYETAVGHPKYNKGDLVIVEEYDNREQAEAGHNKWVDIMTRPELPANLKDVSTSPIRTFARGMGLGDDNWNEDADDNLEFMEGE